MRLVKLDDRIINKRLAVAMKSKDGKKLINEGTVLTNRIIELLIHNGFYAVYIEDENYDVVLHESVDNDSRVKITTWLQNVYAEIEKDHLDQMDILRFIRLQFLPAIKNEPVSLPVDVVMEKNDIVQHSINVAILMIRTANMLNWNQDKLVLAAFIALMHDIGKVLQNKNSRLMSIPHYEVAFEFMKRKNCSVLSYMAVKYQREAYDGSGVYKIEQEKQIDLVKVLAICNDYETRLRSSNIMPYECFEETQALVNKKFDPLIFHSFLDALYVYPVGLPVLLNTKEEGIVIVQNHSFPLRPIVKTNNNYYNLMENLSLFIEKVII